MKLRGYENPYSKAGTKFSLACQWGRRGCELGEQQEEECCVDMLKRWTFINLGQPASLYLLTDLFYCSYFEEKCIKKC